MKVLGRMLGLITVTCLLAIVAGCSGGGGGTAGGTTSVSGVVADGYLQGAYVFLDTKGTKKWDATMPKAVTKADGSYTLDNVSAADLAKFPIVVEVPGPNDPLGRTQAQDKDRGPVTQPYVLQAPPGKAGFVSPLTTLVQHEIEKNGVTPDQAEATVKNNLGLSATTSLFKDFKANQGAAATDEYKHAANIAMVVATTIAQNKATVEAAVKNAGLTGDQSAAITKLILETISKQVSTIVQQVLANVNTTTGALDPAKVANIVTNANVTVSTDTSLTQQLAVQGASTLSASFKDAISGTGLFNADSWQNGQSSIVYEYQKLLLGTQGADGSYPLTAALFNYTNGAWVAATSSDQNYVLTTTGWQLASNGADQGVVTINADGSVVWKHKTLNYSMNVASTVKDISGVPIQPLVAPNRFPVSSTATFPAGSNAYKQTFTPLQTSYRLSKDWIAKIPDGTTGNLKNATSLAAFIAACQKGTNTAWFGVGSSSMAGKFVGTGTTTGSTGTVEFYPAIYGMTGPTLGLAMTDKGTWEIKEPVAGYQVIVITLPLSIKQYMPSYQKSPIFGVANGTVLYGNVEYQGIPKSDEGFSFNKTAFDAILKNFTPSSTPPPPQTVSYVSIEGYVYASSGRTTPIAGAVVSTSLDSQTATTDANGHFFLQTKTPANYSTTPYTITVKNSSGIVSFSQSWNWGDHPGGQTFNFDKTFGI